MIKLLNLLILTADDVFGILPLDKNEQKLSKNVQYLEKHDMNLKNSLFDSLFLYLKNYVIQVALCLSVKKWMKNNVC